MIPIIVAFSVLSLVILVACHVSRTVIHRTGGAADIRSRNYPAVLDPSHDSFMTEVQMLTASFDPHKLADWAEKCTKLFLPKRDVDFVAFIQSVTLCTILAGLYDVDPDRLSPLDVTFLTNSLNCHSDRVSRLDTLELSAITKLITRWIGEERASRALEIISPAYAYMWRLATITFDYANTSSDQHMRNAFLDFSENPTRNQFRAFKVKDEKPSVEAVMKEVVRLHPPMCHIMRKSRHPWWKRLFYPPEEMDDIQPETFDAMRFHPKQPVEYRAISFGFSGLGCTADEWVVMTTALVVTKVIDEVDDVNFTLAVNAIDNTGTGRDTRTEKGKGPYFPSSFSSSSIRNLNSKNR